MAFSLNRAQIIGNLTRDPEIRTTPTGHKVASFGVATNFVWKDASGQRKEKVEYHNIVAWRRLAELCEQYMKKGRKIFVEGRLQTRDWEGEDGVKRSRTEIVADSMIFLDSRGAPETASAAQATAVEQVASEQGGAENFSSSQPPQKGTLKSPVKPRSQGDFVEEEVNLEDLPF